MPLQTSVVRYLVPLLLISGCDNPGQPAPGQPLPKPMVQPNVVDVRPEMMSTAATVGNTAWSIQWCVKADQLIFVVFSGPKALDVQMPVVPSSNPWRNIFTLNRPDGLSVEIPAGVQLMEIVDGRYNESTKVVTLSDFEAFRESRPEAFTIEKLLEFADNRNKHSSAK